MENAEKNYMGGVGCSDCTVDYDYRRGGFSGGEALGFLDLVVRA
jgi:hypothetical protein